MKKFMKSMKKFFKTMKKLAKSMNKAKNMTTGAGYLLRREDYKRVKKMDRQQFESFCKNLYMTAYEEGRKSVPGIDITEVQKAISETPGIGVKRLEAIMESLNSKFAKEEDA